MPRRISLVIKYLFAGFRRRLGFWLIAFMMFFIMFATATFSVLLGGCFVTVLGIWTTGPELLSLDHITPQILITVGFPMLFVTLMCFRLIDYALKPILKSMYNVYRREKVDMLEFVKEERELLND